MPLPSTGPISFGDIATEKEIIAENLSLSDLSTSNIEVKSLNKPDSIAPHAVSEFRDYNHKGDFTLLIEGESFTVLTYTHGSISYNYSVDWGDGEVTTGHTGNASHTYSASGQYVVTIMGTFPLFYNQLNAEGLKILELQHWGQYGGNTFSQSGAFRGCNNMEVTALDKPNTTGVTNFANMFDGCHSMTNLGDASWDMSSATNFSQMFLRCYVFNQDLNDWDVSNVLNMSLMFFLASAFNGQIGDWNVSSVQSMALLFRSSSFNQDISGWRPTSCTSFSTMFRGAPYNKPMADWTFKSSGVSFAGFFESATQFNQDIGGWDTSSVNNMDAMFRGAGQFDQDISGWDTSSVTRMFQMFLGASSFNQSIGVWDVGSVTDMQWMFRTASSFNQPLGDWDVSNVENMYRMFEGCQFDQDISGWDVSKVTDFNLFMTNGHFSTANYNALLIAWSALTLVEGVFAQFHQVTYTGGGAAATARANIISNFGWEFSDGGIA